MAYVKPRRLCHQLGSLHRGTGVLCLQMDLPPHPPLNPRVHTCGSHNAYPPSSNQLRPTQHPKSLSPPSPSHPHPTHMIFSSLSPLLTNTNLRRSDLYTPQPTISSPHPSKPTHTLQLVCAPAMASALFSAPTFQGLRPLKPADSARAAAAPRLVAVAPRRARGGCRAELSAPLVISLSTGLSLFLGRFVFFNFQRENVAKQLPKQNGISHFEAGDVRAKEYEALLKSNDPVGFNIVDVLAWGSIGHIVAYYILATSSNGYDPKFFG